jgi:hypothetical protein
MRKGHAESKGIAIPAFLLPQADNGNTSEIPEIVQRHLKFLADEAGLSPSVAALYHIVNSLAFLHAGTSLCGLPILNPFITIDARESVVGNFEELYWLLRREYRELLMRSGWLRTDKPQSRKRR